MKDCTKCARRKPLDDFPRCKRGLMGRRSTCKTCHNGYRAQQRRESPDAVRAKDAAYRARAIDQVRGRQRAYANRRYRGDIDASRARRRAEYRASERRRLEMQEWRTRNRERWNAICRLAQQKRRASLNCALVVPFTQAQLLARMAYWGDRCYVCHAPWEHVEHVKPISQGGAHCLANLRPACRSCNSSKSGRWEGPVWAMALARPGGAALLI